MQPKFMRLLPFLQVACLMCFSRQLAKFAMLVIFALLMLCYGVENASCATVHENSVDLHALLDFQNGIKNDPYGALHNWNISTHVCRWNGVNFTSTRPFRVNGLNLTGQNLEGQLTSSLGNLTFLKKLDLSYNNLFGSLPLLNQLDNLEKLYLAYNNFQGTIPDIITNSSLRKIDLTGNSLVGAIPSNICGSCSNLMALGLTQNNLSGTIPATLGNITTLEGLYLNKNQLGGSIPDNIWELPYLEELFLGLNGLSGVIPPTLPNMSYLTILGLEFNNLEMELPSNIGELLPSLMTLTLNNNMFKGQIPASLGNISGLQTIDLSTNNFSGQVPTSFAKLVQLQSLNLGVNHLEALDIQSWKFIHALQNCSNLYKLALAENQLQGYIPDSIGNLSTLQYLYLGSNSLSGIVPASIGNLRGLIWLSLDHCSLTGTIEEWIGELQNLQGLYVEVNKLIGSIPPSIGNLKNLTQLILNDNNFEGIMPPSLGNLSGVLVLDLSYNQIQGIIPPELTNLKQLTSLRLSSNKITGEIPNTLDNSRNLVDIQMDQNFLTEHIPPSLGNLDSLTTLNLSHNNFSGSIPMTLSNLTLLYKLDLSYNDLQGEIPRNGVFANATAIYLNNNWRLCGGVMDLHMPVCPAVTRRIKWKPLLIILPILLLAIMTLGMSIYIIFLGKKTSRKLYLLLLSFGKKFPRVSYNDIAQVTQNFSESNLIGKGSYGSVYIGKLTKAKIQVAIKVFDLGIRFADRSFVSECEALRTVRHRNLLPVLTACSTIDNNGNDFKALIYEFMANGNLDTWLHGGVAPEFLGLAQRISICIDVADALAYLHHDCGRPIVHCDLKPTNILLDDDMNAHLGDFGIASLVVDSRSIAARHSGCSSSLAVTGTIGYIAPEYAQTVHATTYGDVYSFGVVLLEMLIGKRPTDPKFEGELNFISFVERNFPDQVLDIIDAHVQKECKGFNKTTVEAENEAYRCVLSLLQVALACTLRLPRERMSMREVTINLHAIKKIIYTLMLMWK